MKIWKRIYAIFNMLQNMAAQLLLVIMTLLVFCAALTRLVDFSLPWSNDLTLLLFAWFAFLAAGQASLKHAHNGVDILTRLLPEKVQAVIQIINNVLMISFLVIITRYAWLFCLSSYKKKIASLGIRYAWVVMACVVGCSLMTLIETVNLGEKVCGYMKMIRGKGEQV